MTLYSPPLRHIGFVLHEVMDVERTLAALPPYAGVDRALIDRVATEAGAFAARVLAPTRMSGDRGCRLIDGRVLLPPGHVEAYRAFVDTGWAGLACEEGHGGQGLPMLLHSVLLEVLNSANPAWSMFPGIAHGAYDCLRAHASDELKARYLPPIASGKWTTSMCLTEAQAGSDLGLVRTKAEPAAGGAYQISGAKIFISGGDHDAAENIVHLVLARTPDAPAGTRGLSLFLVPRRLPQGDGLNPAINGISVVGLEHKMGIRASATCALQFEGALGWLIGEAGGGLACMFVMMNAARLGVGLQALGASELAYQYSLDYARQRRQGRVGTSGDAQPLLVHGDIRRMLLTQKAWTEGARLLSYWLAIQLDIENAHPDAAQRAEAALALSMLTPVAKAFLSDNALEVASLAVQIYGGHGYIVEHGVEQMLRDVRVFSLYEGSNGIQALDLLGRKVLADGGQKLQLLLTRMLQTVEVVGSSVTIAAMSAQLAALIAALQELLRSGLPGATSVGAVAAHFLRALGHAVMAWRFIEAAQRAPLSDAGRSCVATAEFYFAQLFPESFYRLAAMRGGEGCLALPDEVLFADD
ncbi:MAG: acyl-CoA dehydrogenase [Hydrocarboniphaga sp.]|uniref:acyl-CoA dehydrogenase n=1 Tax=Hydrocarboniphaga sp. TaxID=2033016 RepID=UPI00261769EE|nr:acyl-CoA dehydrogenase [Hydrocarboniphaga sp.]MDB5970177.1 acyl-CoA dehydrogenase [Hydrocarboniphaga sp.]